MNRLITAGAVLGLILLVACGAQEQEPAEPEVKFAEGKQLLEDGAFGEALAYFEGQIASTPQDPEAYYFAGQAAALDAEYAEAEAHFLKALELQPETSAYYDWIGRIHGAQARMKNLMAQIQAAPKIKESFEKAVELDPGNLEAKFFLGTFYIVAPAMAGGDRAKGKAIADELLTADPLAGHRLMAQLHVAEKNYEEAEKAYQEALALAPEDPQSHTDLGAFYMSQKDLEKAVDHAGKALELEADFPPALMILGEAGTKAEAYKEKGIDALETLTSINVTILSPNPGTVRQYLGFLYEQQGRMDEARAMYEEAAAMGNAVSSKRLKELDAEAVAEAASADEATTPSASTETATGAAGDASTETAADPAPAEE